MNFSQEICKDKSPWMTVLFYIPNGYIGHFVDHHKGIKEFNPPSLKKNTLESITENQKKLTHEHHCVCITVKILKKNVDAYKEFLSNFAGVFDFAEDILAGKAPGY